VKAKEGGYKTECKDISACRKVSNEVPTVMIMFRGSIIQLKQTTILYDLTESAKSKTAATKLEVSLSRLVYIIVSIEIHPQKRGITV